MAPDSAAKKTFTSYKLGPLTLRNRVIRAGAFEGMTPSGTPSDKLVEHHRALARGGVGMTTISYCSVSRDGLTFADQMHMRPGIVEDLRRVTDAVHSEGAAAALQLGHAGYFASSRASGTKPIGVSRLLCLYTMTYPRVMNDDDMQRVKQDFARSATMARESGFDAIELHLGHGYLLNQFLSPYTNRRNDQWGGSLENRLRFPLEVLRAVRKEIGETVALLAKMNMSDGFKGGLQLSEAIEVARALEAEGIDALVLSGGFVSKTPFYMLRGDLPVKEMVSNESRWFRRNGLRLFGRIFVQTYPFERMFFFEPACRVREAVSTPLVYLGGVRCMDDLARAMGAGFEMVSMARPLILDPDLVLKMERGELTSSTCEPCNKCVAQMEAGGIFCAHPELGKKRNPDRASS